MDSSFCATTPIVLSESYASLTSARDLSRPTVIGTTTPGNSTVFFRGKIGRLSGTSDSDSLRSSSSLINGMACSKSSKPSLRSEEHTSELQSRGHLVCRLLLEKTHN